MTCYIICELRITTNEGEIGESKEKEEEIDGRCSSRHGVRKIE